jgi:hypothetical protein
MPGDHTPTRGRDPQAVQHPDLNAGQPGGTEKKLPSNYTSLYGLTVRSTSNSAGKSRTGMSTKGTAAANSPTVITTPSMRQRRSSIRTAS